MKKCIAFVPRRSAEAWRPCGNAVRKRSLLCRCHERAFGGILLGLCAYDYPNSVEELSKAMLADLPVARRKPYRTEKPASIVN